MEGSPRSSSEVVGLMSYVVRAAQVFGVTATAFLAGQTASTTYIFLPALLTTSDPSTLLRQWVEMLHIGHKLSPPVITSLSLLFTWLATMEARAPDPLSSGHSLLRQGLRTLPRRGRAFAVTAMVLPIIVPYTMYFMWPVNRVLLARAGEPISASSAAIGMSENEVNHSTQNGDEATPLGSGEVVVFQRTTIKEFVEGQVGANYKTNESLNTHALVDRWGWMNIGRAGLITIGAGFAAWGLVL